MSKPHLIVIGGGAAGFFCAVNAARLAPGLQVTLLEKTGKLLQKVKVSGGGRCNLTHQGLSISQMSACYPRGEAFVKKAFHRFFVPHTLQWFALRGVDAHTEADGRMFPVTNSSQTIIDCLVAEANQYGVKILLHAGVEGIGPVEKGWQVQLADQPPLSAAYVCVACGGMPRTEQWQWLLKATGHTLIEPLPSLFTFNLPGHNITSLMGVSVRLVRIKLAGTKLESQGPLLITHWGLSGPAVLRLSAFGARTLAQMNYTYTVVVNWLPAFNETSLRQHMQQHRTLKPNQKLLNTDWVTLPERLWAFLLQEAGIDGQVRWANLPAAAQNKLATCLCSYTLAAHGKTTFKEEFVTCGGIDTAEVEPHTMQSRRCRGLYFAGEVLNVDGITGGFNFQHAWTSGYLAAEHIAAQAGTLV